MSNEMLIRTFHEQLENQCRSIADTHGRTKRGDFLIWWYFVELEGFESHEVEDIYCDGGGDLGIDAVWVDDSDVVHIYAFKNPESMEKAFPTSGVDRLLSGLALIFNKNYTSVANEEIQDRIDAIYQIIPKAYILHVVTSGRGIENEAKLKLQAFMDAHQAPAKDMFTWRVEDIEVLQERFYERNLPAVESPVEFPVPNAPHMLESGAAECYFFSSSGHHLALLYEEHGETLLQRNIRAEQGSTVTNRAIYSSCTGDGSDNFLHFNNGVSFLADKVTWDPMRQKVILTNSQIVNGGQTVRTLSKALRDKTLKNGVLVPVRAISSGGNRQFGSDVTVNQNNQNSMQTGFLRSNDPSVVQLANSLASIGWYLERRKNELKYATDDERARIEAKIGHRLEGRIIPLKEGTQAYVATYFRNPELAKKNPKKMFQSQEDGGYFERIFSEDVSAEKFSIAMQILRATESCVSEFKRVMLRRRRRTDSGDALDEYRGILGDVLVSQHPGTIDQAVPQSAIFLAAVLFQDWVDIQHRTPSELLDELSNVDRQIIADELLLTFDFARDNPMSMDRSWPTMMKSNKFVSQV